MGRELRPPGQGAAGALRRAGGGRAFFDFFATLHEDLEAGTLAVVEEGLAAGESSARAQRAARLLQASELMFWDTLAEGL